MHRSRDGPGAPQIRASALRDTRADHDASRSEGAWTTCAVQARSNRSARSAKNVRQHAGTPRLRFSASVLPRLSDREREKSRLSACVPGDESLNRVAKQIDRPANILFYGRKILR